MGKRAERKDAVEKTTCFSSSISEAGIIIIFLLLLLS